MKKRYRKKNRKTKVNLKFIIALGTLIFSGLMVLGNTYAWFVSEDNEINHFQGTRLSAKIVEEFEPDFQWQPGKTTKKVVSVKNIGDTPAFVRISLYEYLLTFQINVTDQTGNGNLTLAPKEVLPAVEQKNIGTWEAAATSGGTFLYKGNYFIAKKAIVPDVLTGTEMYKFKDKNREKTDLRWFQPTFSDAVYQTTPPKGTTKYWLYQNGYFYYSELLQPGEMSKPILESVILSKSAPNKVKGALYQLNPIMDAHDATKALLDAWEIDSNRMLQELYDSRLNE